MKHVLQSPDREQAIRSLFGDLERPEPKYSLDFRCAACRRRIALTAETKEDMGNRTEAEWVAYLDMTMECSCGHSGWLIVPPDEGE